VLFLSVVTVSLDTTFIFKIFIPSLIICKIIYLFHHRFHPFPENLSQKENNQSHESSRGEGSKRGYGSKYFRGEGVAIVEMYT
jgi:hypothetical protein